MMAEIGVHDDDEAPLRELKPVHVRGAQPQLARARFQDDSIAAIEFLELLRYGKGAIWRGIVDDDEFPVEFA